MTANDTTRVHQSQRPVHNSRPIAQADQDLISNLLNLEVPRTPKLSPDATTVIYCTTLEWGHRKSEKSRSTIWLAKTGVQKSARKLTSGLHNDYEPKWSPKGDSIAFLSDRAKPGKSCALFLLPIYGGGEAVPITNPDNERQISTFKWSPDGKSIAFLSADEKSKEEKDKEENKDDAVVWGEQFAYNKLRVLDVETRKVQTLPFDEDQSHGLLNKHALDISWSPDGTKLAFWAARSPYLEDEFIHGSAICTISKDGSNLQHFLTCGTQVKDLTWRSSEKLCLITSFPDGDNLSAMALYSMNLENRTKLEHMGYGETDDAASFIITRDSFVIRRQHELNTSFDLLDGTSILKHQNDIKEWDVGFEPVNNRHVLAFVQSDINHPAELHTVSASGCQISESEKFRETPHPLSTHGSVFDSTSFGTFTRIKTWSFDHKELLDGIFLTPVQHTTGNSKPTHALPTVVLPHGGPTDRNTNRFNSYYYYLGPYLLHHGYALLLLNYRGSSAYGAKFARYARGGMGKYEYPDVLAVTQQAIDLNYADKNKLIVGGWSQGGFLSYLCAIRNNNAEEEGFGRDWTWKAAIPGAGIVDWDAMALTSDLGASIEAELAGVTPWHSKQGDTTSRRGSALWEFDAAMRRGKDMRNRGIPPMLMLHGEKDERVPVTQAWGMRRALESYGLEYRLVTYPREQHIFKEQPHWADLMRRVKAWCDKYIGPGKPAAETS